MSVTLKFVLFMFYSNKVDLYSLELTINQNINIVLQWVKLVEVVKP